MAPAISFSRNCRNGSWILVCAFILCSFIALPAPAGPQHWGFGFSYLAAIEQVDGQNCLVVYEGPLRAKDTEWIARWLDCENDHSNVISGGLAVGDFWPSSFAREYVVTISDPGGGLVFRVFTPPEVFQCGAWDVLSTSDPIVVSAPVLGATSGDIRSLGRDQVLVATDNGSGIDIQVFTAPPVPSSNQWANFARSLPGVVGDYLGIAAGDFWGTGGDYLALATDVAGQTRISFYEYDGNDFQLITTDETIDLPAIAINGLTAGDYLKDDIDTLTLMSPDGTLECRVPPALPGEGYDPGPEYTGKSLAGQWMPGNGGSESLVVMSGTVDVDADSRIAWGAGRVFGYIETNLDRRYGIITGRDAQIAHVGRSPRKDEREYGWPTFGETVTYTININNNGGTTIPAGEVTMRVWLNTPHRNADTHPDTCDSPDVEVVLDESLPPFDYNNLTYAQETVQISWPYTLVPAGPEATWQRININDVGDRWVIIRIDYADDVNERNDRLEVPVSGLTFHPLYRSEASLGDRQPTVFGDPPSMEYLSRKLADAVQCMWERSATRDGQDVLQRLWYEGYETYWADDQPNPSQAWSEIQAKYEGWRQLVTWWGINQGWERFDWHDGGAELHETGHLFHPVGDLYQYVVSPTNTGAAKMADGRPVQIRTWVWPADSYGSGHTRITWPACEMMRRHVVGSRVNQGVGNWLTLASDQTFVRVLDRDGQPVPGAEVTLWRNGYTAPLASGTTGPDGRWETTEVWGAPTIDVFGLKHFDNGFAGTQIYTVSIDGVYQDCLILGQGDTGAHSQHTRMGYSFVEKEAWTWDFPTNYAPDAPEPDFEVIAAVEDTVVELGITGPSGSTYRLYRKWEPAYIRTIVGEFSSGGDQVLISQNLREADSFGINRFRATYEITRVTGTTETLPRQLQIIGLGGSRGISTRPDGKLILASNMGIANPWSVVLDGTTPERELFFHYRFGHRGNRVAASKLTDGKYYATLYFSDVTPDYKFDLVDPPSEGRGGYDVRNEIDGGWVASFTTSAPYWVYFNNEAEAHRFVRGDIINGSAGSATVLEVSGNGVRTDTLAFGSGTGYGGLRMAGAPGSDATMRELSSPRGLDVIVVDDVEYVIIADHGNDRVAIWDDRTAYVTHQDFTDDLLAKPAAIAVHPVEANKFFVLERRGNGSSKLYLFSFDGSTMTLEAGYPQSLAVTDYTTLSEMGLDVEVDPQTAALALLVTDARTNRVYEYTLDGDDWVVDRIYTQATGVYAGSAALSRPSDVTYVKTRDALYRYAVDNGERVVLLGTDALSGPDCNGNGIEDSADIASGTADDCNNNGVPDSCEVTLNPEDRDCNGNGVPDDCDIAGGLEDDCNGNDIPDACELISGADSDCNNNGVLDSCDIAGGTSEDCQPNGIPDECELGLQPGLLGEYYNEQGFSGPAVIRVVDQVDFDWGGSGPLPGFDPDSFSIRWTGKVRTPGISGLYRFFTYTDDGVRLWVDGDLIINRWSVQPATEWMGEITLNANTDYDIVMEYFEEGGNALAKLSWQPQGQGKATIPASALRHVASNDCNTNGVPDECDIDSGFSEDADFDGIPDECQGNDCNDNGVDDLTDIDQGTSQDCNGNYRPDECDIADGDSSDVNGNGVPDECEADCNANGTPDDYDIDQGISSDCNANGTPDECDIGGGFSEDCQPNGVPDECELGAPLDSQEQDDCAAAEPACPGVVFSGTTNGSTRDGSALCGQSIQSPDVWYVYEPTADGTATISLCNSYYDTVLSVHRGCPGTYLNQISCNDDGCGSQSSVTIEVTAGTPVWIRIAGYNGVTGDFELELTGPPCAGDNSNDCNSNEIPDECETDCNGNGIPDDCDIASGTSEDANGDGVPDECDAALPGDLNCDGVVDFADINPFVQALSGQATYEAAYPGCRWLNADANDDGTVDFADINPFVALLSGG